MRLNLIAVAPCRIAISLAAAALAFAIHASTPPLVQTTDGTVEGAALSGVDAFRGIPFAAPPVGALRWRTPQPVKPWQGVLSTTEYGPSCMQTGMYPPDAPNQPVSEDCLYLNVWRPAKASATPLPVMMWIHGGGLENGSASVPLYAGDELARHGVIVVSANYRLGAFGFLALPALTAQSVHHSSGDYGLMDQIAVLEWVHRNIAAFGGDPDNVTVFGQSSGSISISALTASPLAKRLFQKAIGESGGLFEPMDLAPELRLVGAERQGKRFMARAGAQSLSALRAMPAEKLLGVPFVPHIIIDGYVLPRAPWKVYAEGKANEVSLLIGWNADEGAIFLAHSHVTPTNYYQVLERDFPAILVHMLAPSPGNSGKSALAAAVTFNTDMRFRRDMWRWAVLASQEERDPVRLYEFTRVPPYPVSSPYYGLGATHGVEMQYVFGHLDFPAGNETAADRRLAAAMPAYWIQFARTGNPNGPGLPHWPKFTGRQPQLMQFGLEIHARPLGNLTPLRRISRAYRIARIVLDHWILWVVFAALMVTAVVTAVSRIMHHTLHGSPPSSA